MAERKAISKKLRFEVFKRDNFTCQYCGRMAPDVILEIDHITPVKEKGTNDILNLITSCKDCNRGKGAKKLTDNQTIKKEQEQLKEINEKREQLKLLLKWREELKKFDDEQIDVIDDIIQSISGRCLTEYGRENIKKHIKKYGINEVIESTRISIDQYFKGNDENISKVLDYIPKICANRLKQKDDPYLYKINYIKVIMRSNFKIYDEKRVFKTLKEIIDTEEDFQVVCNIARFSRSWTDFWDELNEYYEGAW